MPSLGGAYSIVSSADSTKLFISNGLSIAVISTSTLQQTGTIAFATNILAAAGSTLLAAGKNELAYFDMSTLAPIGSLALTAIPGSISVSKDGATAVILDFFSSGVETIDVASHSVIASRVPDIPAGFAIVSPDGSQVIVGNFGGYETVPGIDIYAQEETLDAQTLAEIHHTRLLSGALPVYAGTTLFFYYATGIVSVVDLPSGTVEGRIVDGGSITLLAPAPGGKRVFAFTGSGTDVIDAAALGLGGALPPSNDDAFFALLAVTKSQLYTMTARGLFATAFTTGKSSMLQLPVTSVQGCSILEYGLSASPDGKTLLLSYGSLCGFGAASSAPPTGVAFYRTSDNSLLTAVSVSIGDGVAFSPDSTTAYVPGSYVSGSSTVAEISTLNVASAAITGVWQFPQLSNFDAVVISPDGSTLYAVGEAATWNVYSISTATGALLNTFPVPAFISGPSIAVTADGATLVLSGLSSPYLTQLGIMQTATGALTFAETGLQTGAVAVAE